MGVSIQDLPVEVIANIARFSDSQTFKVVGKFFLLATKNQVSTQELREPRP